MNSFAALMVIVACHSDASSCVEEPVAVISYADSKACRSALPGELVKAKRLAKIVYGDCVPVDPALLAGKPEIRKTIDPTRLAQALSIGQFKDRASAFQPETQDHRSNAVNW